MAREHLPELKPLNGREMKCIEYIVGLDNRLFEAGEALKRRLAVIPNGWRDWRLMVTTCGRLMEAIYGTLPQKSLLYLQNLCKHGEILIRYIPASRSPEWMMIRDVDLRVLVNKAMAAECAVCMKEGAEIRTCALRKALICNCPPREDAPTGCGYRAAAMSSEYGHYI